MFNSIKVALKRHKNRITNKLIKSDVRTLEQVLYTTTLSKEDKIKHIRHRFTCYENHIKEFYRDSYGINLRNELNEFISDFIDGKYTIEEFKAFNKEIKMKLEAANDNFIAEQKLKVETPKASIVPVIKKVENKIIKELKYIDPPKFEGLTREEEYALSKMPKKYLNSRMSDEEVKQKCIAWIHELKTSWMDKYIELEKHHKMCENRFIIKLYLENRGIELYPDDFSDLDYLHWSEVKEIACEWLTEKFNDRDAYKNFVEKTLPDWIETEGCIQEDKLLEKIKKLKLEIDQSYILKNCIEKEQKCL